MILKTCRKCKKLQTMDYEGQRVCYDCRSSSVDRTPKGEKVTDYITNLKNKYGKQAVIEAVDRACEKMGQRGKE